MDYGLTGTKTEISVNLTVFELGAVVLTPTQKIEARAPQQRGFLFVE